MASEDCDYGTLNRRSTDPEEPRVFRIVLGKNKEVYGPGECLAGEIAVEFSEVKRIQGIVVEFHGLGSVHWEETRGGSTHYKPVTHFENDQVYFNDRTTVFGQELSDVEEDSVVVEKGLRTFPFEYQLPRRPIPPSFEGDHGFVRYWLKAAIIRAERNNHECKRAFTILTPYDLNDEPEALLPAEESYTFTIFPSWFSCFRPQPIDIRARTDRRGYVPGETIVLSASVKNHTNKRVQETYAKLVQIVRYFDNSGFSITTVKELQSVKQHGVESATMARFPSINMLVPCVPPSGLKNCRFIEIRYEAQFLASVTGKNSAISVSLPVRIGTRPLKLRHGVKTLTDIPEEEEEPNKDEAEVKNNGAIAVTSVTGGYNIRDNRDSPFIHGDLIFTPMKANLQELFERRGLQASASEQRWRKVWTALMRVKMKVTAVPHITKQAKESRKWPNGM
ncbi:hypothetical protein Bbelb_370470 [Branchiostoma belcheri]|nr:hypothetical protein Bbelb_370470 [Branchiostoma belcheri]